MVRTKSGVGPRILDTGVIGGEGGGGGGSKKRWVQGTIFTNENTKMVNILISNLVWYINLKQ